MVDFTFYGGKNEFLLTISKYCASTYFIFVEYNPILVLDKNLDKYYVVKKL